MKYQVLINHGYEGHGFIIDHKTHEIENYDTVSDAIKAARKYSYYKLDFYIISIIARKDMKKNDNNG